MSRSRKRTPVIGNVHRAASEKQDKRNANRRLRRAVRMGQWHLTLRDVSNVWSFTKDGKHYMQNVKQEYMRK